MLSILVTAHNVLSLHDFNVGYLAHHMRLVKPPPSGKRPGTVLIISQTYTGSKHARTFSNANAEFIAKRFTYFGFDIQRVTLSSGQIKMDLSQTVS